MELPSEFTTYTRHLLGESLYSLFAEGISAPPPVSIRLNTVKAHGMQVNPSSDDGPVGWCAEGHYLKERPNFTFDPLFHAGAYYVQDASSMFVSHVLRQYISQPVTMLDLCAAPGGKSTAALSALPHGSFLVANEPIPLRAQILVENLKKWGMSEVAVTNNYPRDWQRSGIMFDVILADVPCSGEGMFRKDHASISEWSVQNVENCRTLQRQIVESAWHCLNPGGLLIYSTCTLNARENEENVAWMAEELGAIPMPVDIDEDWRITPPLAGSIPYCYRFIPGVSRGEGLFMAALRKPGTTEPPLQKKKRTSKRAKPISTEATTAKTVSGWLCEGDYAIKQSGSDVFAIPHPYEALWTQLQQLKLLHAGVHCAVVKGRDLVPQQSLALSTSLRHGAFAEVTLDYAQCIAYLRKESIELPPDTPRGFVLLTYKGMAIGFAKNIGNRSNNLYPAEWKIRSAYIPENQSEILTAI